MQSFLLGGALAGPAIYLLLGHPGSSNQYFVRAAFVFGALLSAWGYARCWTPRGCPGPGGSPWRPAGAAFALA